MRYVVDIDGTICSGGHSIYEEAVPFTDRINMLNRLYDEGHTIIYLTARGMGSTNDNISSAYAKMYEKTEKQLNAWGVKRHGLFLGKPYGDAYIDDRGINAEEFFKPVGKE